MSIWTSLLFLHGHIATPRALAGILESPPAPRAADATPPDPPTIPLDASAAITADDATRRPGVVHHPLRAIGQLA
jgi:hypothetical protein